jgi:hypothetical protein
VTFEAYWLPRLVDEAALALLLKRLLLVLSSNLCVVFQDASPFITTLNILAVDTFTILIAGYSSLEAFTVLFKTFRLFAVTSFGVPLLSAAL